MYKCAEEVEKLEAAILGTYIPRITTAYRNLQTCVRFLFKEFSFTFGTNYQLETIVVDLERHCRISSGVRHDIHAPRRQLETIYDISMFRDLVGASCLTQKMIDY